MFPFGWYLLGLLIFVAVILLEAWRQRRKLKRSGLKPQERASLIGAGVLELQALLQPDRKVEQMPRLRGEGKHWIQYRHVIHSLVKKPGAFRRYRYREDLFPRLLFRLAYDELQEDCPGTSDRQYLKILEWAADEGEAQVESQST